MRRLGSRPVFVPAEAPASACESRALAFPSARATDLARVATRNLPGRSDRATRTNSAAHSWKVSAANISKRRPSSANSFRATFKCSSVMAGQIADTSNSDGAARTKLEPNLTGVPRMSCAHTQFKHTHAQIMQSSHAHTLRVSVCVWMGMTCVCVCAWHAQRNLCNGVPDLCNGVSDLSLRVYARHVLHRSWPPAGRAQVDGSNAKQNESNQLLARFS